MKKKDMLLLESYVKEIISNNNKKILVEKVLILENSHLNESLYKKIKSLGNYSKKT